MGRTFTKNLANYMSLGNAGLGQLINGFRYVCIHAKVNFTTLTGTLTDNRVINIMVDSTTLTGVAMGVATAAMRLGARSVAADGFLTADGSAVSTGAIHSMGGVFDFTGKTIAGFLDGVSAVTGSSLAWANNVYTLGTPTVADSISGDGVVPTATSRQTDGVISEVAVWASQSSPLTLADFVDLHRGIPAYLVRPDILVYYNPLLGSASPEVPSIGQPPVRFDGATGRVNLGTNLLTPFTQATPFTLEMRLRCSSTVDQAIICSQMTGTNGKGIQFGMSNSDGKPILRIQGDLRLQRKSDIVMATGAWVHAAVTYDGSQAGAGIAFFMNGAAIASTIANENVPGDMTTSNPTFLGIRNTTELPYNGDLRMVRIWKGMNVHVDQLNAFKNQIEIPRFTLFDNHASKFAANASQGVATDGTFIYAADDTTVVKHTMAGTNSGSFSHGVGGYKNEDGCVVAGVLYQPLTNHPTTPPKAGKIQLIRTTDMVLLSTITLTEAIWPASICYRDGFFWMTVTESNSIYKYNSSFVLQATYTFPVLGTNDATWPGYSGIDFIGDYLYGNKHETSTRGLDVVKWNGAGFDAVGAFQWANIGTTQGMVVDLANGKVYWAARGHSNAVWQSGLTGGLIGYFKMNEGAGVTNYDASYPGGNHGTMAGGASWVTAEAPSGVITGTVASGTHPRVRNRSFGGLGVG